MIDEVCFRLHKTETIADAHRKANDCFPGMVVRALNAYPPPMKDQPESDCYRRQRSDADSEIDPSWSEERIHDFVRALTRPYPGARLGKLRIWETSLETGEF